MPFRLFKPEGALIGNEHARPEVGQHHCDLMSQSDYGMPQQWPSASGMEKFLRVCRKLTIPTYAHRKCRHFYPSRSSIRNAWRAVAATSRPWIIHPFSRLSLFRELIVFAVLLWMYYISPLSVAFTDVRVEYDRVTWMTIVCRSLLLLNIACSFVTGYVSQKTIVVLKFRHIVRNYVLGYFFFDLAMILPVGHIYKAFGGDDPLTYSQLLGLRLVLIVRIGCFFDYLADLLYLIRVRDLNVQLIRYVLACLLLLHWLACLVYLWPRFLTNADVKRSNHTDYEHYWIAFNKVTNHFFLAGSTIDYAETLPIIITLLCGIVFNVIAISKHIIAMKTYKKGECKCESFAWEVSNYIAAEKLSANIQQRVDLFYKHKFKGRYVDDRGLMQTMSEHLRYEMVLHASAHLLTTTRIIQRLGRDVAGAMLMDLESTFFLAGDIVVQNLEECDEIHFISYGKVALYTETGLELGHLTDGAVCGIIGYMIGSHMGTMVAIEPTEAFIWHRRDIEQLARRHAVVNELLKEDFYERYVEYDQWVNEKIIAQDSGPNAKVHMLLRNRKIIERHSMKDVEADLVQQLEYKKLASYRLPK